MLVLGCDALDEEQRPGFIVSHKFPSTGNHKSLSFRNIVLDGFTIGNILDIYACEVWNTMTKDQNKPLFTISTAADPLGISLHTLRMYEREGLIIPHKKKSGQRLYSRYDIERIECIRAAINVDKISISGIKCILSLVSC